MTNLTLLYSLVLLVLVRSTVEEVDVSGSGSSSSVGHGERPGGVSSSSPSSSSSSSSSSSLGRNKEISEMSGGELRRSSDAALVGKDYRLAVKLLDAAVSLEPSNGVNYLKRYKVNKRRKSEKEGAFGRRKREDAIILDVEMAGGKLGWYDLGFYGAGSGAERDAVEAIESKAAIHMSRGECSQSLSDYSFLHEIPWGPSMSRAAPSRYKTWEGAKEFYGGRVTKSQACAALMKNLESSVNNNERERIVELSTEVMQVLDFTIDGLVRARADALASMSGSDNQYTAAADYGSLIKSDPTDLSNYQKRGTCYFNVGELEQALQHFRNVLKSDPENAGCKAEYRVLKKVMKLDKSANEKSSQGDHKQSSVDRRSLAEVLKSRGSIVSPEYMSSTLISLSRSLTSAGLHSEAVEASRDAISANRSPESVLGLGNALMSNANFEESMRVLQDGSREWPNDEAFRDAMSKCKVSQRRHGRVNHYKTLGVPVTATKEEIKRAYKTLAVKWHPDKNIGNEEEASEMFQKVAVAYEVLGDEEKRMRYDRGEEEDGSGSGQRGGFQGFHHHHHQRQGRQEWGNQGGFRFNFNFP